MRKFSQISKIYIATVVVTGAAVLIKGAVQWRSARPLELLALLAMTLIASGLKVKLPGINGTMSVNLPFLLIVAVRLSSSEAVLIAALAGMVQSIPTAQRRIRLIHGLFNCAAITTAVAATSLAFGFASHLGLVLPISIAVAGITFFFANTIPMALVMWLAEGEQPFHTWCGMSRLSVPYYSMSAGIAAIVCTATQFGTSAEALALLPLMYSVYTSYRIYFAIDAGSVSAAAKPMERIGAAAPVSDSVASMKA
ncbi:MAG TPA: hypothetical protein VE133_16800 [Candidatus Sulfotelmatobacter sp.]|nr:hypothetical protein [Candidatus Sulfotelmatobacter sp.]